MAENKPIVRKSYKLTDNKAPLSFMVPTRNTTRYPLLHFDEKKRTNRALRYAINQSSPFEDEQDGNIIIKPIIFENGFLHVEKENQILQHFLALHPMYGTRFTEIDKEKDAEKELEELDLQADAMYEARRLDLDQLTMFARVMFTKDISKMTSGEIRRDVIVFAKKDPKAFMDAMKDPKREFKAKLKMMVDQKLLTFRKDKKEIWFNTPTNKTKLLDVPFGKEPMYMLESYMMSDDGLDQMIFLEGLLEIE